MDGQSFSREVAFSQSVINIGADQGNDIVLRGSSVADFHVLMHYDSGRWSISPLNGAYRTTINGRSLDVEGAVLQNGSIVEIGTYRLTMMLNGVNTDIIIQSQSGADTASMDSDSIGSDQNIQIEITKMDRTELDAGSAAEIELTVTNAGPLVANMQLQLQGIPSTWVQIIPPVLNLNEGRKGTFLVRISPPRNSSAEAGLYNLHFVAISPNYPRNTGIADTSLTILPYSEFLISGPTPMQLKLSHGKPTDIANFVIINNSNSVGSYFVQSRDDSNELNFAYQKTGSGALAAGQEMVTVRPGDSIQIPMEVTAKKIPLLGVSSKHHHYYTNVTPSDRPGDAQTIAGEVMIKPAINTMLLLLLLAVLIIAVGFIFQPYIHSFECQEGRRSQVIVAGSAAQLSWNVSGFASTIMLNNGQTDSEVSNNGTQYVSPTVSTTYTLTAENFISNLLHITHKKIVQVLVVPSRPAIDVFSVDKGKALYDETVTLNWSVEPNATAASITSNKSTTQLAAENYTGKLAQGYQSDTLISLKAQNDSGYDLKSLFINVASDSITLKKFTVWVRPNGIAIPEDNDVRRTTRWGALELTGGTEQPVRSGASGVNPQPAAQSNTLEIPDNFNSTGAGTQLLNPEVMAAAGQPMPSTGTYSYQPPAAGSGSASSELLVSPSLNAAAVPTAAVPTASAGDPVIVRPAVVPTASVPSVSAVSDSVVVRSTAVPAASPEGSSPNRDFSIKLAEVIEDPLADSGYRVISYYPNYVLQKQEQILVEWSVDGVSKVKIENLSGDDLQNVGSEYAYPEKSTTYTLTAQVGETKKAYSLPVNVAGDSDDGEGSGLKCDLKANATTLKVPGSVMLTWTGGGNNRVQLISSTQAEKENADAEKKKEEEAKAKGEKYEQPKQNQPLTGGTIGDYLQPSGFMRVNVDKQTTFVLNAYDASNNVICTKSVEVKYEGGNDKKDIKLKITKIADENGVSQTVYGKGQMVSYTVALTDFVKGTDPTGAIAITDGTSTCSVNWPVNTCSFQAKKAGDLTITAVYAGDDNYKKVTATAKEIVIDKMPTLIQINSAIKPTTTTADVEVELMWDHKSSYGMVPGGTVTLTAGSTSCDVDMETETMTCAGDVDVVKVATDADEDQKKGYTAGSIYISVKNMGLKDATPDRVTAAYKGNAYFMPSTSQSVLFRKINTQISIVDNKDAKRYPYKPDANHADLETLFNWVVKTDDKGDPVWGRTAVNGRTPTGTISFILTDSKAADYGKCEYDLTGKKFSCEGTVTPGTEGSSNKYSVREMLLANPAADRVRAEYSGDSIFNASKSATVMFHTIPTALSITKAYKYLDTFADLDAVLSWDNAGDMGKTPSGTIKITTRKGSDTVTGTCELDLVKKTMNCEPGMADVNAETGKKTVNIVKLLLSDKDSDRVKTEYSGDSFFQASESTIVLFNAEGKIDTELDLLKASKDSEGLIRLLTKLTWDTSKAGPNEPGGIIVYTSGQATCTLNIPSLKFDKCSGKAVLNEDGTYQITGMVMDGKPGDTIYAEYKGDIKFNGSVSASVYFSKDETTLDIESATKINDIITTTVVLDPAADPTGTITFTSGTATCVLDITDRSALRFEACSGNAKFENGKFVITGMEMNGKPGNSIYAKYSGDGAYEESTSPTVTFISPEKTDTVTVLNNAYMTGADLVSFDTVLSWDKEDALVEDPTGTITFTIGSDTCKLNVEDNDFDCEGDSTEITGPEKVQPAAPETDVKYTWKFKNVQLKNTGADGIKAVYSGDDFFNPSSSEKIKFVTVETELEITEAQKSPTGNAQMKIDLTWIDEPPAGKTPQGTLKLTSGSKTCTLDIKELKFDEKDCAADQVNLTQAEKKWTFEIRKLGFGSKIGSTVSAKYSGDGTFLPSSAADFTYTKLKTELEIEKASKHEELYADINDLILSWDTAMSDGKAPTGTVTLTFGSDASTVCKLEIKTGKFDCSDGSTKIDPPVPEPTSLKNPDPEKPGWMNLVWTLKNVLLKNKTADRVKADYSGDNVFEASSSLYVVFHDDKIDTTLDIQDPIKADSEHLDLKTLLSWDKTKSNGLLPTGTITFTVGNDSCKLTFDDDTPGRVKTFTCDEKDVTVISPVSDPSVDPEKITWTMTKILLSKGNTADRVKAEYSGDANFNASTSEIVVFDAKIDTNLIIETASKKGNTVSLTAKLTPAGTETGTIVFTSGAGTCTLKIDDHANLVFEKCSGSASYNTDGTIEITGMHLSAAPGDSIYAEYSGDAKYNKSTSPSYYFEKVDTNLDIEGARIADLSHVGLQALLSWDKTEAAAKLPAGTIPTGMVTFTIGSSTCKLSFDDESEGHWTDFTCFEKDGTVITPSYTDDGSTISPKYTADDAVITWAMEKILLSGGSTADRVKAEYSGDANFNASSSKIVLFQPIPTALEITRMDGQYSTVGSFDVNIDLSWTEEPNESGRVPKETISLTIGKKVCTLDLSAEPVGFTDCTAEGVTVTSSGMKQTIAITKLEVGEVTENIVKAEYSGDDLFKPSKYEMKVDTTPRITNQRVEPDGTVDVHITLMWDRSKTGYRRNSDPYYDLEPSGTIKLTIGSASCTLQMQGEGGPKFTDCEARQVSYGHTTIGGVRYPRFQILGLKTGTVSSQSIKAEYSGDSLFNKSSSEEVLSPKVDTELKIDKAYKTSENRVNLESTLSWCYSGCVDDSIDNAVPTGPVTFTLGGDSCKLTLADGSFSCAAVGVTNVNIFDEGGNPIVTYHQIGDEYYKDWKLKLTNVLLSNGNNTDRVKAEFAGDGHFNASSSDYVLFPTVETQTRLNNQVKMPDGRISVDLSLSWMQTPPDETMKPTGTIKFTSGTGSCTLDLSTKQFTGCSGEISGPTQADMTLTYAVTGLKIGDGKGESIKAEYSGNGIFLGSSSNELFFTKVDTELEITSAFKPNDTGLANTVTILSWDAEKAANRKPAGTVKYTVGSGSCTLDLTSKEMDCESLKPIDISTYSSADRLGYRITIENMALSDTSADSIKAEYSGDPVFNASSNKAPFRTVDTEIVIRSAYKPDEKHVTATAELDWDVSAADGRMPRGNVKFVVGSGSCTLNLETSQLSCDPELGTVSADRKTIKVKDMLVDDSSADRISAEYSGDGFFNPSKSVKVLIDRIDTEITIPEAYKSADAHVSLKALLSWDESIDVTDEDPLPTGTLKVTVGDKMFTYDLETKELTPEGGSGDENAARQEFTFTGLPFDDIGAETVKVEYSGDRYYGPSSVVHTFDKIQTETVVLNYYKGATQDAMDRLTAKVIPEKLPFDESEPRGPFDVILSTAIAETQYTITCPNIELNGQVECEVSYYYPLYLPHPVYMKVTKDAEGLYNIQFSSQALDSQFTATVRYKGDTIFKASQYDYEYNESEYKNTETWIDEAIQLSNGHKYVKTTVRVPRESSTHQSPSPTGKFVLTASNGKTCWFVYETDHDITTNCGDSFAVDTSYGSYYNKIEVTYYLLGIAGLGEEELSSVSVVYEGSETLKYHGSASDPASFSDSETGPMSIEAVTTNYSGEVTATVYMVYTKNKLLDDYGYPAGPLVITKGNYTCTIPLKYGTNSGYTLDLGDPSVSEDCGGGTVNVRTETISDLNNKERMILELRKIPVSDHVAPKFRVSYIGDGYYKSSDAEEDIHNRVNSNVSFSVSQQGNNRYLLLTVSSADTSQTATPSGNMDIFFKDPSGNMANHCVWKVAETDGFFICDQTIIHQNYSQASYAQGSETFIFAFTADRPVPTEYASVELSYEGNENYNPSSGSYPMPPSDVIITPLTDDLYDDGGRLYFNTNPSTNLKQFPKFPEIYKITDCDTFPGECRSLKNKVPLKVSIRVKDYQITDNSGHNITTWPFSEDIHFTSGSDFDVSCTPIYDRDDGNDRLYTCEKEASFSTTGIKYVQAGLGATWLNNTASAEFPEMIAVKVPDSPLYGTTLIIRPETNEISAGSTVEVEADTTYNGSSIHPSAVKNYIYYTWSGVDAGNTRIDVCPDTGSTDSCQLNITDDTKWIVAEFLGNDTYAPSTGLKSVGASPVTLGIVIGGGN